MKDVQAKMADLTKALEESQSQNKKLQDELALAKQPADKNKKPELVTEEEKKEPRPEKPETPKEEENPPKSE